MGGDSYFAFGSDFMFPLPILPKSIVRGHTFLNGGALLPQFDSLITFDPLKELSLSAGAGLIVRFTSFRLELNYCIPLQMTITDLCKPGFQFGIGMHFL